MRWGDSAGRIAALVRKELRQMFRDPRMWRIIFVAPLIQLLVFGYAVSTDVRHVATFVVDQDHSAASRALVDAFTASGYFRVAGCSSRPRDVVRALERGDALAGFVIPPDYGAHLRGGRPVRVQLLLDGTDSNSATVALGYAQRIAQRANLRFIPDIVPAVDLRARVWFNPELVSRDYNVPAVSGAIVFLICLLLTALAVVRERELGTLEQLNVSPVSAAELIAGKTIPFALTALIDAFAVTLVAVLWFKVPFAGSVAVLVAVNAAFILSGLGLGLLISTVSQTQQEAFMTTFLVFMPTMLLSGLMFPVASMPAFFQWVTLANPMRHYLEIVRAVFLKGAGIEAFVPQFTLLVVIGVVVFTAAVRRFHKTAR